MANIRVLMLSKACIVGIYQRKLELIAQSGIDLRVIVPPSWRDERGETPLERTYTSGYALDVLPIRLNGNFHLHFYGRLGEQIQHFQPHIVHIDEEPYNLATWQALHHARRNKAKSLFFSWQNIHRDYPLPFRYGERWVLNRVEYAIMGTQSAADVWRAKGYHGPYAIIPQFGADTGVFKPADEKTADRPFTIGYIGRLVQEKGIHILLEAAAKLDGAWRLHIIGSGPMQAELLALAQKLNIADRVQFKPWVPSEEIPAHYHQLDTLVMPSLTRPNWKEQFGRVMVEAMSSGVPVIGSDSGAIPDVIGEAGLIVPEGSITQLRDALHALQYDPVLRAHYGWLGQERVKDHYTHEKIAAATVQVYHEMLGEAAPAYTTAAAQTVTG